MRRLECIRGGQPFPFTLANGDTFDSVINVYDDGRLVYTANHVNTDPSRDVKSFGILSEGHYRYICGLRRDKPNHPKVLYIYRSTPVRESKINTIDDLVEMDRVLPSLIPNPNHENKKIISDILVHNRAWASDGSAGCITVDLYDEFINGNGRLWKGFEVNEKGDFDLVRSMTFNPDERYRTVEVNI